MKYYFYLFRAFKKIVKIGLLISINKIFKLLSMTYVSSEGQLFGKPGDNFPFFANKLFRNFQLLISLFALAHFV